MNEPIALEDRVAMLEREVTALKRRVGAGDRNQGAKSWFDVMAGEFENDPEFEEVLRLGREFRQSQDTSENSD